MAERERMITSSHPRVFECEQEERVPQLLDLNSAVKLKVRCQDVYAVFDIYCVCNFHVCLRVRLATSLWGGGNSSVRPVLFVVFTMSANGLQLCEDVRKNPIGQPLNSQVQSL